MIVFMGVAGAGKSVQGKMLAEHLGYTWISTGELLRAYADADKKEEMLKGKLLKDQELIELMQKAFRQEDGGYRCIIDGFPRTIPQADWLLDRHNSNSIRIDALVHIKASEEAVKSRLLARGRPDDNEEAINKRFQEYRVETLPILEEFKSSGVPIIEVDGNKDRDIVSKDIQAMVEEVLRDVHKS